ncbi:MAG: hypothetical protein P1P84_13070 [Deferrisomatales bacterium]|nr:hypothetical protein [Deferrisomatales bacterium]
MREVPMKFFLHALAIGLCGVALASGGAAAQPSPRGEPAAAAGAPAAPADLLEIVGTVAYKDLEGGFYAIDGDDGEKYDPINLPEAFRKDGLRVKATARLKPEMMGFHMYGAIVEIVEIAAP